MKINTTIKMITLSTLVLFTACVDQNSLNFKKEKEMREEATLDINKMPLQTYDEYIKVKRFVLEKYIENQNAKKKGVAYLNDGSKIKYNFGKSEISERILHYQRPFVEVLKMYYTDSQKIKNKRTFIANLNIEKTIIYNYFGEVQKVFDKDSDLRKKGLNYKKLLEGAEEQGFIDLKEGTMLQGDSFKIHIEEDTAPMTREEKEEFSKEVGLSYTVIDDFIKDKYFWRFDIEYSDRTEMYSFTRDGIFVAHLMTSRVTRY